jgi:hypothetical protein
MVSFSELPCCFSDTGRSLTAFRFVDPSHAKNALAEMNGFELAGRQIRVGLGNDKFTPESTANLLRTFSQQAQSYQGSAFSGAGGRGAYAGGSGGVFDRTHSKDDRGVSGASALDDTDVAGVNFKTYDRSKLMDALARRDNPEPAKQGAQPVISKPRAPVVDKPMASKCIKIENAFDPDEYVSHVLMSDIANTAIGSSATGVTTGSKILRSKSRLSVTRSTARSFTLPSTLTVRATFSSSLTLCLAARRLFRVSTAATSTTVPFALHTLSTRFTTPFGALLPAGSNGQYATLLERGARYPPSAECPGYLCAQHAISLSHNPLYNSFSWTTLPIHLYWSGTYAWRWRNGYRFFVFLVFSWVQVFGPYWRGPSCAI